MWNDFVWTSALRERFLDTVPLLAFAQIAAFVAAGLYRGAYRYMGIPDLLVMFRAMALATAVGWVAGWVTSGPEGPSLTVTILHTYFLATLVVGSRISFRILEHFFKNGKREGGRRVLIDGAGNGGALALREIQGTPALGMRAVGFLDDDPRKRIRVVNGCPIFGPESLEEMVRQRAFDELVVATPKISPERVRLVAARCVGGWASCAEVFDRVGGDGTGRATADKPA